MQMVNRWRFSVVDGSASRGSFDDSRTVGQPSFWTPSGWARACSWIASHEPAALDLWA
jgi:hypothetical protein